MIMYKMFEAVKGDLHIPVSYLGSKMAENCFNVWHVFINVQNNTWSLNVSL